MYLVLILNLMRGVATEKKFGVMPNFLINYLLEPERIKSNLKKQPILVKKARFYIDKSVFLCYILQSC